MPFILPGGNLEEKNGHVRIFRPQFFFFLLVSAAGGKFPRIRVRQKNEESKLKQLPFFQNLVSNKGERTYHINGLELSVFSPLALSKSRRQISFCVVGKKALFVPKFTFYTFLEVTFLFFL